MNGTRKILYVISLKTFCAIALLTLAGYTHAGTPLLPQQDKSISQQLQRPWLALDSMSYQSSDGVHQLVVYRKNLANFFVTSPASVDKYMKEHPEEGGVPNMAYVLQDTSAAVSKICWVKYVCRNDAILPHEHWFVNVVWPAGESGPYVLLTKSISTHLEVSLYRVSLKSNLGALADEPDLARFREWPTPSKPISTLNVFSIVPRLADGVDGLSHVTAVATEDGLLLRCEREAKTSPPVYISFSKGTGLWRKGLQPDALQSLDIRDKQE